MTDICIIVFCLRRALLAFTVREMRADLYTCMHVAEVGYRSKSFVENGSAVNHLLFQDTYIHIYRTIREA